MFLWTLALVNLALTFVLTLRLSSFAKRHPTITTREDLDRYRSLIAIHMGGALLLMALTVLIPLAILTPSILQSGYVDPNWWPIAVTMVPLMFRSKVSAAETGVRTLQVSTDLSAEYEGINKVWTGNALRRFPRAADLAAAPASPAGDSPHYQAVRDDHYDEDLALRRDSYTLTSIGIGDLVFGTLTVLDDKLPELHIFAGILLGLGAATFVSGTLLSWRIRLGYKVGLVCAALHWLLPPIGTALGLWAFISMRRSQRALAPAYREALGRAKVEVLLPWLRYVIMGVVIVHVYGATLFMASILILTLSL